jgi:hypothetical protein
VRLHTQPRATYLRAQARSICHCHIRCRNENECFATASGQIADRSIYMCRMPHTECGCHLQSELRQSGDAETIQTWHFTAAGTAPYHKCWLRIQQQQYNNDLHDVQRCTKRQLRALHSPRRWLRAPHANVPPRSSPVTMAGAHSPRPSVPSNGRLDSRVVGAARGVSGQENIRVGGRPSSAPAHINDGGNEVQWH